MKEIKLMIDGKEAALTEEQIKALGIDVDDGCVCDRVKDGECYYSIGYYGTVDGIVESNCRFDCGAYKCGNYYRDEAYAKQVALHQHLNNLLRRYSEQNGGDTEWDGANNHFTISFGFGSKMFYAASYSRSKECGVVYFGSPIAAQKAIEEVVKPFMAEHPDFVW